jgi:CheY-like chemotaxis protein
MTSSQRSAIIIEDDAKQAEIFSQAISLAGFSVQVISDGAEALAALSTKIPDLVLLDLHLPHVSGDKLLEIIRTTPQLKNTKVIITTADAEKAFLLNETSDLVLIKPISFNQLRELAGRLFQGS